MKSILFLYSEIPKNLNPVEINKFDSDNSINFTTCMQFAVGNFHDNIQITKTSFKSHISKF